MLGALLRLILYRFVGARIMLGLAILGWLRRLLSGRRDSRRVDERDARQADERDPRRSTRASAYQPSQGESQIAHREPR